MTCKIRFFHVAFVNDSKCKLGRWGVSPPPRETLANPPKLLSPLHTLVFLQSSKKYGVGGGGGVVPNCFISFPAEKHVFITIRIPFFSFSGKYSRLL